MINLRSRNYLRIIFCLQLVCCYSFAQPINTNSTINVALVHDDLITQILFDSVEKELGLEVVYHPFITTDIAIKALLNQSVDFVTNVTYTDRRSQYLHFSAPTNVENIYLFSKNNLTLQRAIRVALPAGSPFAEVIHHSSPGLVVWEYDSVEQGLEWLETGIIDGIVDAINVLDVASKHHLSARLLNLELPFKPVSIVTEKDSDATQLSDAIIKVLHSEKVQRRLRVEVAEYQYRLRQTSLREQVRALPIDLSEGVSVYLENVFPHTVHNANSITGISADVVFSACDILNVTCYVKGAPTDSWQYIWKEFKKGSADIIAPLTYMASRERLVYYTAPYYTAHSIIVKRKGYKAGIYTDLSQMITEKIGVVKGDFFEELLSEVLPYKTLYLYENQAEQLEALINGDIDFIALDQATYYEMLRSTSTLAIEQEIGIGSFNKADIALGFNRTEKGRLLAPLFSQAIQLLEMPTIIQKYDYQPNWRNMLEERQYFNRVMKYVVSVGFFIGVMVILYLHRVASTDALTGLKNRRSIYQKYRKGVPKNNAIVYLDVNNFKQINDTYGHLAGDIVLKEIANKIKHHWKGMSYRIGGDEFVLIGVLKEQELEAFKASVSNIIVTVDGRALSVAIAVGFSHSRTQRLSLDHCLKSVDSEMYCAKLMG